MTAFRYQAIEGKGLSVQGMIEAEDRKAALQLLGERGVFPSSLEISSSAPAPAIASLSPPENVRMRLGQRINRKEITAFTREMGSLLGAGISIPQALDGLGQEEENPAL